MDLPFTEPFKIKMVENIYMSTREQREEWIKDASYNIFNLRSEQVFIDMLTDSGEDSLDSEMRNFSTKPQHIILYMKDL